MWLVFCASTAGDLGLIPGQGTKILQAMWYDYKEKKKKKKRTGLGVSKRIKYSWANNTVRLMSPWLSALGLTFLCPWKDEATYY